MKTKGEMRIGFVPIPDPIENINNYSLATPLFIHGIFSFLSWWFISWWFFVSVIGFIYEKKRFVKSFHQHKT